MKQHLECVVTFQNPESLRAELKTFRPNDLSDSCLLIIDISDDWFFTKQNRNVASEFTTLPIKHYESPQTWGLAGAALYALEYAQKNNFQSLQLPKIARIQCADYTNYNYCKFVEIYKEHHLPKVTAVTYTKKIGKVGIALAAYKPQIDFFIEQLKSIQNQSFNNWICLITCDSPINEFTQHTSLIKILNDPRFILYENPHRLGSKLNFETCAQKLLNYDVDAIACADQDDIWYSNKLEVCVKELENLPNYSLVHSDMHQLECVDNQWVTNKTTTWHIEKRGVHHTSLFDLTIRNVVAGAASLFDRDIVRKFPQSPNSILNHDHWYALVASKWGQIKPIYTPLYAYRQHGKNVLGAVAYKSFFSLRKGIKVFDAPFLAAKRFYYSRDIALDLSLLNFADSHCYLATFYKRFDFGLHFLFLAVLNFFTDRPLARACVARAFGKCASFFISPQVKHKKQINKIAIALTVYKPPVDIVYEQLQSIQNQTYKNYVCVITVDSPIAEFKNSKLGKFFDDPKFVWVENATRLGAKKNFEHAMQLAAKYPVDAIACADQDDVWYPDKLDKLVAFMQLHPPLSLCHCDMHYMNATGVIDKNSSVWQLEKRNNNNATYEDLLARNLVTGASMIVDADLVRKYPYISNFVDFHDQWYAMLASLHGGVFGFAQQLQAYRQHGANAVGVSNPTEFLQTKHLLSIRNKSIQKWHRYLNLRMSFLLNYEAQALSMQPKLFKQLCMSMGDFVLLRNRIGFLLGSYFDNK